MPQSQILTKEPPNHHRADVCRAAVNLSVLVVDFAVALYLGLVSLPIVRLIPAVLPWQFTDWIRLWCIGRLFTKYSVLHFSVVYLALASLPILRLILLPVVKQTGLDFGVSAGFFTKYSVFHFCVVCYIGVLRI